MSAKSLTDAIGERMRALREERGLRQDDVAQAARRLGFHWTRAAVAKLEAGQRGLNAGEFLFLPEMINFASITVPVERRKAVVELADLLPSDGWIALTNETRVRARALQMLLQGQRKDVSTLDLDVPLMRHVDAQANEVLSRFHRSRAERQAIWQAVWPEATEIDVSEAVMEAAGEAEQKAASRLGAPPIAVALEARRLWQRSLTAERDRRVASEESAESEDSSESENTHPRSRQAVRGHVTRLLITELESLPNRLREAELIPARRASFRGKPVKRGQRYKRPTRANGPQRDSQIRR
jgi:transcriptional regulator with XRE-family HTH domain